ncbi:hypothetical protein [Kitasatospora indigofera]|uniref:hypothetical protein n=1 Tax=Kitasatospora indigofera TaxID=67307 RepID=UPI0033A68A30
MAAPSTSSPTHDSELDISTTVFGVAEVTAVTAGMIDAQNSVEVIPCETWLLTVAGCHLDADAALHVLIGDRSAGLYTVVVFPCDGCTTCSACEGCIDGPGTCASTHLDLSDPALPLGRAAEMVARSTALPAVRNPWILPDRSAPVPRP